MVSNIIIAQLLFLQMSDPKKDIHLYINSPGGSVTAGLAVYDTMQYLTCDVNTYCVGQAASMGAVLLAAGTKGKRYALPNARILIHQPWGGVQGQASDISIQAREILRLKDRLNEILAKHTGKSVENIGKDTDRDNFMSSEDADEEDLLFPAGQRRVKQVALQHHEVRLEQHHDDGGILTALALVDADGVGRGDVAEIAPLQHVSFAVKAGRERPVLRVDGDDRPDVTVKQALVVVVAELDELVAGRNSPATVRNVARCRGGNGVRARGPASAADGPSAGFSAFCNSRLRLATPATPLCMGASTWTSRTGCSQGWCRGMNSVQSASTLCRQSSADPAAMKLRSLHGCIAARSCATGGGCGSPALMAWAVVTIRLWPCWR